MGIQSKDIVHDEELTLKISREGFESFVICLTLGTLRAIREGTLKPEAGIWTIGRPVFWRRLEKEDLLSPRVLQVLQTADEIDALYELAGSGKGIQMIDELIEILEDELKTQAQPLWRATWE